MSKEVKLKVNCKGPKKRIINCPSCGKKTGILIPADPYPNECIFDEEQKCSHCESTFRIERTSGYDVTISAK